MESKKKIIKGKVIKTSMDKTIVVKKTIFVKHKLYKKYIKKNIIFFVHDEFNICKINDDVLFFITRPISKKKHCCLYKKI